MISSLNSTISALQAFGKKMGVSANNIANVATEEFRKSRAVLQEAEKGSVRVEISTVETPGPVVTEHEDGDIVERELSNVDLLEELPQTIVSQRNYEANLKTLQTAEVMVKTAIDIIG